MAQPLDAPSKGRLRAARPRTGHLATIDQWVTQLGEHCAKIAAYYFRELHLTECQLDELWTFVCKKEDQLTPLEQMLGLYGPAPKPPLEGWLTGRVPKRATLATPGYG